MLKKNKKPTKKQIKEQQQKILEQIYELQVTLLGYLTIERQHSKNSRKIQAKIKRLENKLEQLA